MMPDLLLAERHRLKVLVARQRTGRLTTGEEDELRQLIGREWPRWAATLDVQDLGRLGLGMMGAWYLLDEGGSLL
jgi:hypothetical protein